jgi:hypothetical protein
MIPLTGFAPDADVTTPGLVSDCTNFVPYLTGMEGGPEPATPAGVPALASACYGASVVTKLDDTRRIIAGTSSKLYELFAGSWLDRSRVGSYTALSDARWSITQFGNTTIASNKLDAMQSSDSTTFADIATAPKASIVYTVGAFVMALDINDGTDKTDGWACCAAYDATSWTPNIATQATTGRLVSSPGRLTAGMRLGEYAIAYKSRSIYLGQYVGAPAVWNWIQVPGGEAGCVGKDAVCDIGGAHFFVGEDNIWVFDGTRPVPVADGQVRQWFYDNSSPSLRYKTTCVFDRQTNRVWIFYISNNGSSLDSALVYHVLSKKWGRADRAIEAAMNYTSGAVTMDTMDTVSSTFDGIPPVSFDSQFWLSGGKSLSIFNSSHQLQSLTGNSVSSSFTTGDNGDDDDLTTMTKVRLRYAKAPTTATVLMSYQQNSGAGFTSGVTGAVLDGKFDVRQTARWHKAKFSFTGPVKVTHMEADVKPAGKR